MTDKPQITKPSIIQTAAKIERLLRPHTPKERKAILAFLQQTEEPDDAIR